MPLQQIFQVAFSPDLPPVFTHLSNHKVLEDDNIFLHHQGQTMSPGGKQDIGIGRYDVEMSEDGFGRFPFCSAAETPVKTYDCTYDSKIILFVYLG